MNEPDKKPGSNSRSRLLATFNVTNSGYIQWADIKEETFLGYSQSDLVGKPILEIYSNSEKGKSPAKNVFTRLMSGNFTVDEEMEYLESNGTTKSCLLSVYPFHDREGQVIGSISFVSEIESRVAEEKELFRLAAFPSFNPNPVIELDGTGDVIFANQAVHDLIAGSDNPFDEVSQLLPENIHEIVTEALITGESKERLEVDVAGRTVGWSFHPIQSLNVVHGYGLEVTELKRSHKKIQELYDTSPAANFHVDRDGIIRKVNETAVKLTGFTKLELIGSSVQKLYADSKDGLRKAQRLLISKKQGNVVQSEEMEMQKKDGTLYWAALTLSVSENGEYERAVLIDISDRKKLRKATDALQKKSHLASIGRLSAMVAHQVNNPLSAIRTNIELMELDHADDISSIKMLEIMQNQVVRISKVVKNLLGFARHANSEIEKIEIVEVIDNVLDLFDASLKSQGIEVFRDYSKNIPRVSGPTDDIQEIFVNLIENARQESSITSIWIRNIDRSDEIEIIVEDNGDGLGKNPDFVFEPYYSTKEEGTGIGLPVARKICIAQGGNMYAENWSGVKGCGARFGVILSKKTSKD
ncbi:MAG: PAS domain S-box protein [Candidatus Lindowbacteria bacterium]|nr:PAS domain S-box protein [Candidatus Lindowbacteria bacterium]